MKALLIKLGAKLTTKAVVTASVSSVVALEVGTVAYIARKQSPPLVQAVESSVPVETIFSEIDSRKTFDNSAEPVGQEQSIDDVGIEDRQTWSERDAANVERKSRNITTRDNSAGADSRDKRENTETSGQKDQARRSSGSISKTTKTKGGVVTKDSEVQVPTELSSRSPATPEK